MNLTTIFALLQVAIGLLSNPNLAANPALQQQAIDFSNQAVSLANIAIQQLPQETLDTVISTSTPPALPIIPPPVIQTPPAPTDTETGAGLGTSVATPETISVNFSTSTDALGNILGFVAINNTTGGAVRVVNLDVPGGTFDHLTFSDSGTWSFGNEFSCTGLGSKGYQSIYGNNHFDPCARMDNGAAINEIAPGETMTLQYGGNPSAVVYQSGSIVDVATGADVQF
jgi:hypothetical protein